MKKLSTLFVLLATVGYLVSSTKAVAQTTPSPTRKANVAILIFDGVQIVDYTGPYEVLGSWSRRNVYTVAEKATPITTHMGMRVVPNYTFENSPKPDILVIPGGGNSDPGPKGRGVGAQLNNETLVRWIRESAAQSQYVMSVCNGAFLLARAGLLDGLEATTTAGMTDLLQSVTPKARVVADRRFVDNGKVMTTAGLTSGIDGALHLVEKLDGLGWAQLIAKSIEYNWQPESRYARAALADMNLPDSIYEPIFPVGTPLLMHGGVDAWAEEWSVPLTPDSSASDVLKSINERWAKEKNWVRLNQDATHETDISVWKFTDRGGKSWIATASAEANEAQHRHALVKLKIASAASLEESASRKEFFRPEATSKQDSPVTWSKQQQGRIGR
jgi:putative intracellular protease/amidase